MSVSGVEENAQSRFIDYTFATPWESLSSEIERALKKWLIQQHNVRMDNEETEILRSLNISYLDGKYTLYFFRFDSDYESPAHERFASDMRKWFDVTDFFLFAPNSKSVTMTSSQRQTLFSAVCSAIHSSGCTNHPAFIVPSDYLKMDFSSDLRGYEVKAIPISETDKVCCVVMYESASFDGIDARHELYYMDGLLRFFDQKLSAWSIGTISVEGAICTLTEIFHYNHDGSPLSQRLQLPYVAASDSSVLLPGSVYSHHNYLSQLWSLFPDYHPITATTAELEIKIRYVNMRQGTFLDNERYTTFQPSKQNAASWSVRAGFTPLSSVAVKKMVVEGQLHTSPSMLSCSLRRLLSFFIYSHVCNTSDVPMTTLLRLNKSPETKIKNSEKSLNFSNSAKLSSKTKFIVDEMCSKIPRSSRSPDKNKFMSLVFSHHNRWPVDVDRNHPASATATAAGSLGNLSELIGVTMGSLSIDMQSIAEIWSDCVLELRKHWESEWCLPAVWSPLSFAAMPEQKLSKLESSNQVPSLPPTTIIQSEDGKPFWQRHLWNDKLKSKTDSSSGSHYVSIPDVQQHVLIQKLQLLNLCITFKRDDLYIEIPTTVDGMSPASSSAPAASLTRNIRLQRRIPSTVDAAAQVKKMEEKFTSNKSRTLNENPLLRWQVTHPALVSDIKAYKHAFPTNSLQDFLSWYSAISGIDVVGELPLPVPAAAADINSELVAPTSVDDDADEGVQRAVLTARAPLGALDTWVELWAFCEACPVEDQRVLFRIETEAEKCLAYLEDMSARSLSLQLLRSTVHAVYIMIHNELRPWFLDSWSPSPIATAATTAGATSFAEHGVTAADEDIDVAACEHISSKLYKLRADIELFDSLISDLFESLAAVGNNNTAMQTIVIEISSSLDSIIDQIDYLEEYIVQTHEIGTVLMLPNSGPGSRFVTSLCRQKECVAKTDGDMQSLFELVKFVSRGSESHSWNSEDGRELGKPTKKTFALQCQSASRLVDTLNVVDTASPLLTDVTHVLYAEAEDNKLTVSLKFCEFDS